MSEKYLLERNMVDYYDICRKFDDDKLIAEICDDVSGARKLSLHFLTQIRIPRYVENIKEKYKFETKLWNYINPDKPKNNFHLYIMLEKFLCAKAIRVITRTIPNYQSRLTPTEIYYVDLLNQRYLA